MLYKAEEEDLKESMAEIMKKYPGNKNIYKFFFLKKKKNRNLCSIS